MSEPHENDEGPGRARPGMAEAEAALESEHERYLREARERTNAVADRLARAAGYPGLLRPGKIVRLKSGGPPMTIAVVDIVDGLVYCHFFWRGSTGQARYGAEMLEPCEAASLDTFVPPPQAGPNTYDAVSGLTGFRAPRQRSRKSKASESRKTRARRQSSPKSKVNRTRKFRAPGEPTPEQIAIQKRRESDKAWREHMRRLAHMKRVAREREKRLREEQATAPDKHGLGPLPTPEPPIHPQEEPSRVLPEPPGRTPSPALEPGKT